MCPLAKDECIEENCAWYVSHSEACAINIIALSMSDIVNGFEEDNNEN